jgi:hypothetical protein
VLLQHGHAVSRRCRLLLLLLLLLQWGCCS